MVRPIVRDTFFLTQKAQPATEKDLGTARDLRDTLLAHTGECVGMAANMIGVAKRIIAIHFAEMDVVMLNPVITEKSGRYDAEEGCLSLDGKRRTTRYRCVTVEYQDERLRRHTAKYEGFAAQIIQHECDHLEGILI